MKLMSILHFYVDCCFKVVNERLSSSLFFHVCIKEIKIGLTYKRCFLCLIGECREI